MDPVTAVGLASGILTFVQAGLKLAGVANQIYSSVDGILDENKHRESIAKEVKQAASRLETNGVEGLIPQQKSLLNLARECQATSTELINVLDDVKPRSSSTNYLKVWKDAIKATRKEDAIKSLERRLEAYRNQLTLGLVELSKAEAEDSFKEMLSLVTGNEKKLKALTKDVQILRQGQLAIDVTSVNSQAYNQVQQLLMIDEKALNLISQDRILRSLKFQEVDSRYEAIHEADKDSFKWIYEEVKVEEDNHWSTEILKMQHISRTRFLEWLSSEMAPAPIFHISGKLGSGKSTLVKFLCSHPRAKTELEQWAGDKTLVFASFFFWRNGTILQKSLHGLCCSLLHDVLIKRPDLIPEILPEHWQTTRQAPWQIQDKLDIRGSMIKDALNRVLENQRLYDTHRFCFFIDGLDEFEPGAHDDLDYLDLVEILRRWTNRANGNLKLCVSSREEPVFMDAFTEDPNFRLQDLTRFDMQDYARRRLDIIKDSSTKQRIIDDIPEKSSGIFLWTYLVVRTIRNKMSHGLSDESLEAYLESLPQGLEALFAHVLDNLNPDDERRTLRTIDLLKVAKTHGILFPLVAFSLWNDYEKDPEFSIRDSICRDEKDIRSLEMQLRGTCGGLIESQFLWDDLKVLDFVHRSIPDMFYEKTQTPELGRRMDIALKGFNTVNALSHLSFGAFRLSSETAATPYFVSIALMRLKEMNDQPPYQFLECLDSWINDIWFESPQPNNTVFVEGADSEKMYLVGATSLGEGSVQTFYSTICLAAFVGQQDYFDWKLKNDPKINDNTIKKALVTQSVLHSKSWEYFFDSEVLNQPFTSNLIPFPGEDQIYPIDADSDALTPWQYYIGQSIWVLHHGYWVKNPSQTGEVIERFLEQGEDPFCQSNDSL
ncbi:hypothetical protein FSARC_7670 [Fusarium sarcochroum]|uniref:Nephrocystin 3-like N-terminal domain-containing protein n=1 Tax=Fusarium sarcochroum TaxID=1208366 RepID=A0A8H4TUS7_9HYPO|nr:hypothetical protein FSARC_7670 [Fusarium sarcochroum]